MSCVMLRSSGGGGGWRRSDPTFALDLLQCPLAFRRCANDYRMTGVAERRSGTHIRMVQTTLGLGPMCPLAANGSALTTPRTFIDRASEKSCAYEADDAIHELHLGEVGNGLGSKHSLLLVWLEAILRVRRVRTFAKLRLRTLSLCYPRSCGDVSAR